MNVDVTGKRTCGSVRGIYGRRLRASHRGQLIQLYIHVHQGSPSSLVGGCIPSLHHQSSTGHSRDVGADTHRVEEEPALETSKVTISGQAARPLTQEPVGFKLASLANRKYTGSLISSNVCQRVPATRQGVSTKQKAPWNRRGAEI